MISNGRKIWFPAKKYGWGWGLRCAWQGWVVLVIWMVVFAAGAMRLARHNPFLFLAWDAAMIGVIGVICLIKGEKPRWRWGGK